MIETVEKVDKKTDCFGSTIGMMATHRNMPCYRLVRVNFYNTKNGNVCLQAVSGHDLSVIKCVKQVFITVDEYNDREFDYYDSQVEYQWALRELGMYQDDDDCDD